MIAGMMILFLIDFDFGSIQNTFYGIIVPQSTFNNDDVQKVNFSGAIKILNSCWSECSMGDLNAYCGAMLIQENDFNATKTILNKEDFEDVFTKHNFCTNCNIEMDGNISLPGIISAECKDGKIIISK